MKPAADPEASAAPRQPSPAAAEAAGPQLEWSAAEEDFGRWERKPKECEIQVPEQPAGDTQQQTSGMGRLTCRSVRLDQQLAGLLSIRFLPLIRGRGGPSQQLLFAGVLLPGSQPMRCMDGRCEPRWPMQLQLSALATSNVRTLGLPEARVVQGNCSLEQSRLLCTARDHEGRRWQATVRW